MKYSWKRFWCPRDGNMNLSDGGFLYDPESEYAKYVQQDGVPFETIAERSCLALLGEPGIGKTTVMEGLRQELGSALSASDDCLLYINLNEYGEESRLIHDLFECEEFAQWRSGSHVLHLFLDSLDECRIHIPQVAALLSNRFKQVGDDLKRIRLRIACRTADWPPILEQHLPCLWGAEEFGVYELAFLRRKDVEAAAQAEEIASEAFIDELTRTESVPLAIKPITLHFLLSVFKNEGKLPHTRAQLYEEGCKRLCEEYNPNRLDLRRARGAGVLSAQERLRVAARIAAVSVFCGRPTIFTGVPTVAAGTEQITVPQLAQGQRTPGADNAPISEDAIREALGTGLFSSRGHDLMGFSHQTYAEFLAGCYLREQEVDTHKILQILQHPSDPEGRTIPQLYAVTAWVAGQDADVFGAVARHDPQVLLRCDEGTLTEKQRETLVESLLCVLQEGRENIRDWDLWRHYRKLSHGTLGQQLEPWIADTDRNWMARHVAIEIGEECKVSAVQTILADLALREDEGERLRGDAAHAIAMIGDAETRARLRPLVFRSGEDDVMDHLKGNALRALWPGLIPADELFEHLTLPKRHNYHGAYVHFAEYELAEHLDVTSLPTALKWLKSQVPNTEPPYPFDGLADDIVIRAWRDMDDAAVLEALAETCLELLRNHRDWVRDEGKRKEHASLFEDIERRRRLAEALVNCGLDPSYTFELASPWRWPQLLRHTDLDWCIQKLLSSVGKTSEVAWADLVWSLFVATEPCGTMLDNIIEIRAKSPELAKQSKSSFDPVELGSDTAKTLKSRYDRCQSIGTKDEPGPLEWLPRDRIEHWLTRFEKGEPDAWCILLRQMILEDTGRQYDRRFEPDITALPGWRRADTRTRERILNGAENYLIGKGQYNTSCLLDGASNEKDIAAYKAFLVLLKEASEKLEALPDAIWCYWVPVLFGPFGHNGDEDFQKELIGAAYQRVPEAVTDRLEQILRHQIGKGDQYLSVLDLVADIWDQRISHKMHGLLEAAEGSPLCWRRMLRTVLAHSDSVARQLAERKLQPPLPQDGTGREVALRAAMILVETGDDAAWPLIWPLLQQEPIFGRELITEVAYEAHHDYRCFFGKLDESKLADLYIWLAQEFPYSKDPDRDGVYSPTKEDSARDLRTAAINALEKGGTLASCQAIQRVVDALPTLDWLRSVLVEARRNTLQATWQPITPQDFLRITVAPGSWLVRNADELQELLVDVLSSLDMDLQGETPAASDLWDERDKGVFRPKDENHLSDWVKRHIDSELDKRPVVAARELQIRRGEGTGIGENTDIHVTALVPGLAKGTFDKVCVIIEAKGCWHKELKTAMQSQLVERYLKDNQCQHGIYLVGWYVCEQWDNADYRRAQIPKCTLTQAREFFAKQATDLSAAGPSIRAIVLNTALR